MRKIILSVVSTLAVIGLTLGSFLFYIRGQPHLFSDAIVLSLFCIAGLLDGLVHAKGL